MRVTALGERMRAVGPSATLERGYAIARSAGREIVRDPAGLDSGDELEVVVRHGTIAARVESTQRTLPDDLRP